MLLQLVRSWYQRELVKVWHFAPSLQDSLYCSAVEPITVQLLYFTTFLTCYKRFCL
jgi:hypothetical protein